MKVKIIKSWWRWPHIYGAETTDLYKRNSTGRFGLMEDGQRWEMPTSIAAWLDDLPPIRILGRRTRAACYILRTNRERGFHMMASGGRLTVGKKPPVIWFARKSDILLMKISHG